MKAVVLFAALLAFINSAHAQGTVMFSNSGGQPAYICDETGTYLPQPGSTAFLIGLYYASDGISDESQFAQLGNTTTFNAPTAGYFSGGSRTAPTQTPGGWGMFQIRAWEAAYGATYEEAVAGGIGAVGKSNIIRVNTGHPEAGEPPASLTTYGLEGFQISSPNCVPEPHLTRSVLVISALVLALRLRKRL